MFMRTTLGDLFNRCFLEMRPHTNERQKPPPRLSPRPLIAAGTQLRQVERPGSLEKLLQSARPKERVGSAG